MKTLRYRFRLSLAALFCLTLASCVTVPPIADRTLSQEEQRLIGTWTTSRQRPDPLSGFSFSKASVIHIFPDRTSRITEEAANLMRPDQVQDRRWELVNGLLRETWGMGGATSRCTFLSADAFRIDDQNGASYVWHRQSTRPDVSTKWAMDMEGSRDTYARLEERSAAPQSDFEKFMMKPVGEVFPNGVPASGGGPSDQQRERERAAFQYNQYRAQQQQRAPGR